MIRYLITMMLIITVLTMILILMGSLLSILHAAEIISHYSALTINHTQIIDKAPTPQW